MVALLLGIVGKAETINVYKVNKFVVIDGDTIAVTVNGEAIKIRLLKIDCFETVNSLRAKWQAEVYNKSLNEVLQIGRESKMILVHLMEEEKENIYVELKGQDRFRRRLGTFYILQDTKFVNVNHYMLEFGRCVPYKPKPRGWKPYKK